MLNRISLFEQDHKPANISRLNAHCFGHFFDLRLTIVYTDQLAGNFNQFVDIVGDMDRQTDRSALINQRALDRLTNPPGRISRKTTLFTEFETLDSLDQAQIAFLDKV
jgi:hypothetical protein